MQLVDVISENGHLSEPLPEGFFESIQINDPAVGRPPQGEVPAVPTGHC